MVMMVMIVWLATSASIFCPLWRSFKRDSPFCMNLYATYSKSFCMHCAIICMVLPASLADADLRSST